jgi:hypothetical protein
MAKESKTISIDPRSNKTPRLTHLFFSSPLSTTIFTRTNLTSEIQLYTLRTSLHPAVMSFGCDLPIDFALGDYITDIVDKVIMTSVMYENSAPVEIYLCTFDQYIAFHTVHHKPLYECELGFTKAVSCILPRVESDC